MSRPAVALAFVLFAVLSCTQNPGTQTAKTGTSPASTQSTATQSTPTVAPSPAVNPRPQFFAGTVLGIAKDQITVSRTLVGHQPDTRSFQLTPKTQLNANLCKRGAKVTVRYQRLPEGNVALRVLVHRSATSTQKKPS